MSGFTFETEMKMGRYAAGVQAALWMDLVPEKYLTDRCTECGESIETMDQDEHVIMVDREENQFVLVACEGYWVVNPSVAGLPNNGWDDWTEADMINGDGSNI